jgi:hypothetical protein
MDFIKARVVDTIRSFFAPPKLMDTDPCDLLLTTTLSLDAELFLVTLWSATLMYGSPIGRLKLTEMHFKKKKQPPGHEFIFVRARDTLRRGDPEVPSALIEEPTFVVERMVELNAAQSQNTQGHDGSIVAAFLNHPDCKLILSAVEYALTSIPTSILVAGAAAASPAVASAALPLSLASTLLPSSSPASSSLPFTNPITEPSPSLVDRASLKAVDFFHHLSEFSSRSESLKSIKPPKDAPAVDRWVPGRTADGPEYEDLEESRWTFRPINLTVFHLALLVCIVHKQYPLYSLFKRNCFWFAALIFTAAKILDRTLHKGPEEYPEEVEEVEAPVVPKEMIDLIFMPLFLLAPDALGRWMGFKVCEVKRVVVNRIVEIFLKQLEEHECQVDRLFFLIFQ